VGILLAVIALLLIIGLSIYFVIIYNSLVRLRNDIDKAWANIDVLLKQRHDELPKLIDTCKGYMQYEQQTLLAVTDARSAYGRAGSIPEKALADNQLTGALRSLFAVAEKYPDLKANANFLQLEQRITALEEEIADRREFFNDSVNTYNIRIRQLPDTFVASLLGLQRKEMFQASEEDRQDVEVKLA
jgi:LemA protein